MSGKMTLPEGLRTLFVGMSSIKRVFFGDGQLLWRTPSSGDASPQFRGKDLQELLFPASIAKFGH
jgi:hypothetical protein